MRANPTDGCVIVMEAVTRDDVKHDVYDAYISSILTDSSHTCPSEQDNISWVSSCGSSSIYATSRLRAWTYREAALQTATDWQGEYDVKILMLSPMDLSVSLSCA